MNELATWLRAQLDEDERVAKAADAGRWLPEDKGITFLWYADEYDEGEAQARLAADTRANQDYIADWHPARVLAEVDAKRRMLDLHEGAHECSTYRRWVDWEGNAQVEIDSCSYVTDGPCSTVALLALPYADRPGYRDEWRPDA